MPHSHLQYTAYLALGSNLDDRLGYLASAVRALSAHPQLHVVAASGVYETEPVGPVPQGAYLNACLHVRTSLPPLELLHACLQIETNNGRVRTRRFGPRTLDIDLLLHNSANNINGTSGINNANHIDSTTSINSAELILPHPRLHQRAFVLIPLADIAPELLVHSRSVADWLRNCPQSDIDDVQPTTHRLIIPATEA